jgi:hypothetical protein
MAILTGWPLSESFHFSSYSNPAFQKCGVARRAKTYPPFQDAVAERGRRHSTGKSCFIFNPSGLSRALAARKKTETAANVVFPISPLMSTGMLFVSMLDSGGKFKEHPLFRAWRAHWDWLRFTGVR